MRVVHEGRGGYIEIDDKRYPIELVERGHFSIHYVKGRNPKHAKHLEALERLVREQPEIGRSRSAHVAASVGPLAWHASSPGG